MSAGAVVAGLESFWLGMALHLWQSTVVLAVLVTLALGLRNAPARYGHALLWMALLKFMVPLSLLGVALRPLLPPLGMAPAPAVALTEYVRVVMQPGLPSHAGGGVEVPSGFYVVLTTLWVGGVAWIFLRWLRRSRRAFCEERDTALARAPREIRERVMAALRTTAIAPADVRLMPGFAVPAVRGVARPRILLSEDVVRTLTEDELRAVLAHEESHRRRHDTRLSVVQRGVLAVFFFYPPVWWLIARLRASAECACDESVLGNGVAPAVYARALARVLASGLPLPRPAAVCLGRTSGLRARLDRIENAWRYRVMTKHRLLLLVSVLVVLGSSTVPFLLAEGHRESSETAGPTRTDEDGFADLDRLVGIDGPITITLANASLATVFQAFEDATATRFRLVGDMSRMVDIRFDWVPARTALERLAREHGLQYAVKDGWTVVVRAGATATAAVESGSGELLIAGVGDVTNPRLIADTKVQPEYPEKARADRVEGQVIFQAIVRADGTLGNLEVLQESNPAYEFAAAGREAIYQWRYEPATRSGLPVDVYFTIFVEFKLH